MATLRGSCRISAIIRRQFAQKRYLSNSRVLLAEWNKNWKPGPYPKTQEEREAAAKKYGMIVEDYEPYPDDGKGFGDYPKLPDIGDEGKDPHSNWDDPALYRNFGEPVNIRWEQYTADRYNPASKPRFSYVSMTVAFLALVLSISGIWLLSMPYPVYQPKFNQAFPFDEIPKRRGGPPGSGERIIHYTFEPAK